ncbi:hypothetical protein HKD37_02G005398 [Glycine soja]
MARIIVSTTVKEVVISFVHFSACLMMMNSHFQARLSSTSCCITAYEFSTRFSCQDTTAVPADETMKKTKIMEDNRISV